MQSTCKIERLFQSLSREKIWQKHQFGVRCGVARRTLLQQIAQIFADLSHQPPIIKVLLLLLGHEARVLRRSLLLPLPLLLYLGDMGRLQAHEANFISHGFFPVFELILEVDLAMIVHLVYGLLTGGNDHVFAGNDVVKHPFSEHTLRPDHLWDPAERLVR